MAGGAIANCSVVEHMPWFAPLYRERLTFDNEGGLLIPDRPGLGFTFDPKAIQEFCISLQGGDDEGEQAKGRRPRGRHRSGG